MQDNIPQFLYNILLQDYGKETINKIIEGYTKTRITTLRVNTSKTNVGEIQKELTNLGIRFKEVTWNKTALVIENAREPELQELEMYQNGEIYLQSLSSMIPPIILEPKKGETILDMAAAPGGKTTQMANLSNNEAMITACEKNKIRAERLKFNLQKQGATRVNLMIEDARKLDDFFSFDKILLDAPCSGSGTLNINNINKYTEELVERSIKTQRELLQKAIKLTKKNGEIIYSTCSILKDENERILKEIFKKAEVELVPINKEMFEDMPLLPTEMQGTICICPTELYEGFFVAKLRKIQNG